MPTEYPAQEIAHVLSVRPDLYELRLRHQAKYDADALRLLSKRQKRIPSLKPQRNAVWDAGNPWENVEAADLSDYLAYRQDLKLWFHCPNERAKKSDRLLLGKIGVRSGVPDFHIEHGARGFKGLKIELKKRQGRGTTKAQETWLQAYRDAGFVAEACKGASQAIALVEWMYGMDWLRGLS